MYILTDYDRMILGHIKQGRQTIGELKQALGMEVWDVEARLTRLRGMGLIGRDHRGRVYVQEHIV